MHNRKSRSKIYITPFFPQHLPPPQSKFIFFFFSKKKIHEKRSSLSGYVNIIWEYPHNRESKFIDLNFVRLSDLYPEIVQNLFLRTKNLKNR